MNEEQFVSIDLDDDNICSVCKLGTEKETLSFCHVCFELNIEDILPHKWCALSETQPEDNGLKFQCCPKSGKSTIYNGYSWCLNFPNFKQQLPARVPKSDLLHTRSLRGHRDCFEKFHLIANQDCPRSKLSKSPYAEVKNILSKKINWIIQYAQNKDLDSDSESSKPSQHQLFSFRHQTDRKLLPQFDSPVPRYSAKWIDGKSGGISSCSQTLLEPTESTDFRLGATFCCSSVLWSKHNQVQKAEKAEGASLASVRRRHPQHSREEHEENYRGGFLNFNRPKKENKNTDKIFQGKTGDENQGNNGIQNVRRVRERVTTMTLGELKQLNEKLLKQIQDVFEELAQQVQEKDSLASELNVRHIAIEQLLKNCSKLPCLQVGRAGLKSNVPI